MAEADQEIRFQQQLEHSRLAMHNTASCTLSATPNSKQLPTHDCKIYVIASEVHARHGNSSFHHVNKHQLHPSAFVDILSPKLKGGFRKRVCLNMSFGERLPTSDGLHKELA
jgi:hypothetical protein